MMVKVVGIKFLTGGRTYYFSPGNNKIKLDDYVIVETERGLQLAKAVTEMEEKSENNVFLPLKEIVRIDNKNDLKTYDKNEQDANKALEYAKKVVEKEKIDMKLFEASYTFDRKKLIFKFIYVLIDII